MGNTPLVLLGLVCFLSSVSAQFVTTENDCDWDIWDSAEQAGVISLSAACSSGRVAWHHPYGAVRLNLSLPASPPLPAHVRVCVSLSSARVTALLAAEQQDGGLRRLLGPGQDGEEACVDGGPGGVRLFLQAAADASDTAVVGHVTLSYDLERLGPEDRQDPLAECRPCTEEELLEAACTADFVASGSMESVEHGDEHSRLLLSLHTVHRQPAAAPPFSPPSKTRRRLLKRQRRRRALKAQDKHTAQEASPEEQEAEDVRWRGSVLVPRKCGVRRGRGQFVFLGRLRLARPVLRCAPDRDEFQRLWRRAERDGRALCSLDS